MTKLQQLFAEADKLKMRREVIQRKLNAVMDMIAAIRRKEEANKKGVVEYE